MPPLVPLLLGIAFVLWLLHRDMCWRRLPSRALWIAVVYLILASSRAPSFWYHVGLGIGRLPSNLEGSPINVVCNTILFLASIVVLGKRDFSWRNFFFANKALVLVYAFYLWSMLWSPFPVASLKRVIQEFGCVIVGLVILTEKDVAASLHVVFVRASNVLFPLSVVFMKYFPNIGRQISPASGFQMMCGVADHKNSLGQMAMVFCLILLWDLIETRKHETSLRAKPDRWSRLVNLGIGLYLLIISSSATSWICFLVGVVLLFLAKPLARTRRPGIVFVLGVFAMIGFLFLNEVYGISGHISEGLERGEGMSGRRDIWRIILEKNTNPLIGVGFHVFWETSVGELVSLEYGASLNSAHNGYLEIYLSGGLVAVFLLGLWIWSTGINVTSNLAKGDPVASLALLFWPILLLYNVTESAFFQIGTLWFTILLVTINNSWQDRSVKGAHY